MVRRLFLLIILAVCTASVSAQEVLKIHTKSGGVVSIPFANNPEMTFGEGNVLKITSTKETVEYTFSDVEKLVFEKDSTNIIIPKYKLTYMVDNRVYKVFEINEGEVITPEPVPTKEGYTFSGWSDIPATMPAHDVTVTGSFTVNKYKLTYTVDGAVYKTYDVEYGATITPEANPAKEGYTFSGWSDIPATMPAHDVTVTGSFTQIDFVIGDTTYEVQNGEVTIKDGSNQSGEVEIQTSVVINGQTYNVTSIADAAFKDNNSITSVTIPQGITVIGAQAFDGCKKLNTISIGKTVVTIGSKAFANITSPASAPRRTATQSLSVRCYAENVPTTAFDAFEATPISQAALIVEDNSVSAYKSTSPWNQFGTIMGITEATGIYGIRTDENASAKIYSLDGKPLNETQKGVNIIRMNDGRTKKVMKK